MDFCLEHFDGYIGHHFDSESMSSVIRINMLINILMIIKTNVVKGKGKQRQAISVVVIDLSFCPNLWFVALPVPKGTTEEVCQNGISRNLHSRVCVVLNSKSMAQTVSNHFSGMAESCRNAACASGKKKEYVFCTKLKRFPDLLIDIVDSKSNAVTFEAYVSSIQVYLSTA
eukprot:3132593-Amphidinium_carterae.1